MNRAPLPPSHPAPPRVLRLGLLGVALAAMPLASAQALYGGSEQAGPGATISVRGDALDGNARFGIFPYTADGKRGAGVVVAPDTATGKVATLRLPKTLASTMYEIVASTSRGVTNSFFVNRARMQWTDVPDAMPGQTVRIVGRNFIPFNGLAPTVTLINAATKVAYPATVASKSDTVLKVTVPAGAPAGTYTISMNNGVAGSASADPGTLSLTVRAAATDPFNLGVAWGADCNGLAANVYNFKTDPRLPAHGAGNGAVEEGPALAACLWYLATHGGGVLYVPAGIYRIDDGNSWSVIYGNTVVRGAGKGQTILQTGYTYNPSNPAPDYHYTMAFWGGYSQPEGIADLTIQNLNTSSTPNGILMGGNGVTREVFLKNVDFQMGNAKIMFISTASKAMIADCGFTSTSPTSGTLSMTGATEFQYLRNTEYHRASRLVFNLGNRGVLEGNTIQFDNNYRNASSAETGDVEMSGAQQVLLMDNNIGALGGAPNRVPGDGEVILTQISQIGDFMYTGMVKAAAQRVLTPTAAFPTTAWQNASFPTPASRMAVMIIAGKGAGQWRRATSWTSTSVVVDTNWQVNPDATSRFAIGTLNNYQQTVVNNRIYGGFCGIEWEDGAMDSTIQGNTLTNTGFIGIFAYVANGNGWGAHGSNSSFTAAWGNSVLKNTLNNMDGSRPATISVCGLDLLNQNYGPLVLGTDVRGNTIVGHFSQPIASQYGRTDGLEVISIDPGFANTINDTLVQGTVLQDNAVSNSDYPNMIYFITNSYLSNVSSSA